MLTTKVAGQHNLPIDCRNGRQLVDTQRKGCGLEAAKRRPPRTPETTINEYTKAMARVNAFTAAAGY